MTEIPDADRLAAISHHRWSPAVLAELHRRGGAKTATLLHVLGVGRDSLRRSLDALAALGLAARNPGYGHPLRPEWILTADGARLAPACAALLRGARRLGAEEAALRKWSVPVLHALGPGEARFSALGRALPSTTPRALAAALRTLEESGLVARRVLDGRPPAVAYRLERRARGLVAAAVDMAAAAP